MRRLFALALATLFAAASGCGTPISIPSEAELSRSVVTVVHEPAFTLFSPYDAASTAHYADTVRDEVALVRKLLPDDRTTPVRLYLDPIEDDGGRELAFWETPSHRTLQGAAREGEVAFVYVPARVDAASAFERAAMMHGGTLRHELAHVWASRAGLSLEPWFDEGLALEVECMRESGAELHANPFPVSLLYARKSAVPGALAQVLDWRYDDDLSPNDRTKRYVWSHALMRYLFEQRQEVGFAARARAVMNLDRAWIVAEEPKWLAWLAGLDALARIRAGARSASASERAAAIAEMPSLAESGVAELFTRAADDLAIEMVVVPECMNSAATFLLFFRARDLRPEDVERMNRSDDPASILTAQALHAKRMEPVDLERARSAWRRIAEHDRPRFIVLEAMLPEVKGP